MSIIGLPRGVLLAGTLALAPLTAAVLHAHPSGPDSIHWSIDSGRSLARDGKVQLTIESRWGYDNRSTWSNDRPLSDLQGLSASQLAGARGPVRFALQRDAGRLDCSGVAGYSTGSGSCSFIVDPRFASYLQQRGMGSPTPHQAFTLTMSGVGRDLIDSMQEIGYARPTVDQLASMGIHGVSADFVR